jgi:hypothetical protein
MNFFMENPSSQYQRLLKERALLTERIINLRSSSILAIRESERIEKLDRERGEIHRRLERIGRELGKTPDEVQLDVLAEQFCVPNLGLVGLSAIPAELDENEEVTVGMSMSEGGATGMFFVFENTYSSFGWEGEGVATRVGEDFRIWLTEKAENLVAAVPQDIGGRTIIKEVDADFSGVAHVDRQFLRGIYVCGRHAEAFVSWVKMNPEAWISKEEYLERRELIWVFKEVQGHGITLKSCSSVLTQKEEKILEPLFSQFEDIRLDFFHCKRGDFQDDSRRWKIFSEQLKLRVVFTKNGTRFELRYFDEDSGEYHDLISETDPQTFAEQLKRNIHEFNEDKKELEKECLEEERWKCFEDIERDLRRGNRKPRL